jgi:hypothetical protein
MLQCGSWESTVHAKAGGPGNAEAVLLCAVNTGPTRYCANAEATPADTSIRDGEKNMLCTYRKADRSNPISSWITASGPTGT